MDKQNAKRAASMVAAATVGSTGGTIGADAVINNNNDSQEEIEQPVAENSVNTSSLNQGQSSSHVSPSVEPHVEVVIASEDQEPHNPEPSNPDIINEPIVEPVEPVTPVEPITPVDPIDPIEPIEPIQVMYGGPDDPTIDPIVIDPEPDMYGGPVDPLYNPDDDDLMGMPAIDDDEIPSGDDTVVDDPSCDYNTSDSGDVDYMV